MGSVKWTEEQQIAIEEKGSNILVAAAAGSGKTAVLVERIIHKIVKDKIDIDTLLVVTFTNAAASEMRERILDAIYTKLEETPEDVNLQRQILLINKASICTIHSFCLDVIKNNFYEIDISPNFRIGDTAEIELLKQEVLDELFEEKYEKQDANFLKLIDIYTGYRGDEPLKEILLTIYRYIQSNPFPEEWLEEKVEMFHLTEIEQDFGHTIWGTILLQKQKEMIIETKVGLGKIKERLDQNPELTKFSLAIQQDIENLQELENNMGTWDKAYQLCQTFTFTKWPVDKKITSAIKEEAKIDRDKINKKFKTEKDKLFIYTSKQANEDLLAMYEILEPLKQLILEFSKAYSESKKEKNIIDFNDIEHLALQILVEKKADGSYQPSKVAQTYKEKFSEIAIDEYQDSNLVQEYILNSISKGNNIFMVGDVKQSIYRFRQARPELFLEKYDTYTLKEQQIDKQDLKIQLFKNFRSRENILSITNIVFQTIMSKQLGDINYTKEEYLNLGANYQAPEQKEIQYAGKIELDIINRKEQEKEQEEEQQEEQTERIEDTVIEAKYVAKRIKELVQSNYYVYDKKQGYRKITYKDIVVLLRATSAQAPIYEKEIAQLDIPVFSDTSSEYLNAVEIQTIMAVLKLIDNPMQDISLVTVLRSMIGGFTDNDLIQIRLADKHCDFYEAMLKARLQVKEELKEKIDAFLDKLDNWRKMQEYKSLDELIWQIYTDTGYYHYVGLMTNGALRQANLKMLFERAKQYESASFKGLFNFINFIDKLKLSSGDLGAAKIIGENENVVRIMSIHKSKGLEFPVVFLSGTGKQFNMMDLNQNILLHQEIGLGPKYINYEKRIEYSTLAKEAIRIKAKKETLSEEMRVLYVALTRSKEKLIITGMEKDAQKAFADKEKQIELYQNENKTLPYTLIEKYKSYLDWLELVYINNKDTMEGLLEVNIINKEDIIKQIEDNEIEEESIIETIEKQIGKEDKEKELEVTRILEWEYPMIASTKIPSKISVTRLKEMQGSEDVAMDLEELQEKHKINTLPKPKFLRDTSELTGAEKGTVMHLCMQKLNSIENYTIETIKELVEELVAKQMITRKEADTIRIEKLLNYTKSKIGEQLKKAKLIEKEKPFYITIPAKQIYKEEVAEQILVQGIIDLYYVTAEDELVLVDYKTDYVENRDEEILKEKYKVQLQIYANALEQAMHRKVDKIYIYSIYLGKEIEM